MVGTLLQRLDDHLKALWVSAHAAYSKELFMQGLRLLSTKELQKAAEDQVAYARESDIVSTHQSCDRARDSSASLLKCSQYLRRQWVLTISLDQGGLSSACAIMPRQWGLRDS